MSYGVQNAGWNSSIGQPDLEDLTRRLKEAQRNLEEAQKSVAMARGAPRTPLAAYNGRSIPPMAPAGTPGPHEIKQIIANQMSWYGIDGAKFDEATKIFIESIGGQHRVPDHFFVGGSSSHSYIFWSHHCPGHYHVTGRPTHHVDDSCFGGGCGGGSGGSDNGTVVAVAVVAVVVLSDLLALAAAGYITYDAYNDYKKSLEKAETFEDIANTFCNNPLPVAPHAENKEVSEACRRIESCLKRIATTEKVTQAAKVPLKAVAGAGGVGVTHGVVGALGYVCLAAIESPGPLALAVMGGLGATVGPALLIGAPLLAGGVAGCLIANQVRKHIKNERGHEGLGAVNTVVQQVSPPGTARVL